MHGARVRLLLNSNSRKFTHYICMPVCKHDRKSRKEQPRREQKENKQDLFSAAMEQPNQWLTPTEQDELAYMYQMEGGHVPGPEQQFAEPPLPDHQEQYYTPPMAAPSFHPSRSSNFPTFGGSSSLPSLPFGAVTVKNEQGQPSPPPPPRSSKFLSFGAGQGSTLNFSGGAWQPDGIEETMQLQAQERRTRAPGNAQEHVIAERKRREKLQQQFVSLATIVPGLKKTDKISLLGGTIEYVKELEEKVKALEEQGTRRSSESTVFESKCSISAADSDAAGPSGSGSGDGDGEYSSPAVEANVRGNTVLLKICCKERRGVLVMVLTELENQGLSIINTNVVPFTDSCLNITITAKIEEGFSSAVELVKNLTMALRSFN